MINVVGLGYSALNPSKIAAIPTDMQSIYFKTTLHVTLLTFNGTHEI